MRPVNKNNMQNSEAGAVVFGKAKLNYVILLHKLKVICAMKSHNLLSNYGFVPGLGSLYLHPH